MDNAYRISERMAEWVGKAVERHSSDREAEVAWDVTPPTISIESGLWGVTVLVATPVGDGSGIFVQARSEWPLIGPDEESVDRETAILLGQLWDYRAQMRVQQAAPRN